MSDAGGKTDDNDGGGGGAGRRSTTRRGSNQDQDSIVQKDDEEYEQEGSVGDEEGRGDDNEDGDESKNSNDGGDDDNDIDPRNINDIICFASKSKDPPGDDEMKRVYAKEEEKKSCDDKKKHFDLDMSTYLWDFGYTFRKEYVKANRKYKAVVGSKIIADLVEDGASFWIAKLKNGTTSSSGDENNGGSSGAAGAGAADGNNSNSNNKDDNNSNDKHKESSSQLYDVKSIPSSDTRLLKYIKLMMDRIVEHGRIIGGKPANPHIPQHTVVRKNWSTSLAMSSIGEGGGGASVGATSGGGGIVGRPKLNLRQRSAKDMFQAAADTGSASATARRGTRTRRPPSWAHDDENNEKRGRGRSRKKRRTDSFSSGSSDEDSDDFSSDDDGNKRLYQAPTPIGMNWTTLFYTTDDDQSRKNGPGGREKAAKNAVDADAIDGSDKKKKQPYSPYNPSILTVELYNYVSTFGDANVPPYWIGHGMLAQWTSLQRQVLREVIHGYRTEDDLTKEEIEMLKPLLGYRRRRQPKPKASKPEEEKQDGTSDLKEQVGGGTTSEDNKTDDQSSKNHDDANEEGQAEKKQADSMDIDKNEVEGGDKVDSEKQVDADDKMEIEGEEGINKSEERKSKVEAVAVTDGDVKETPKEETENGKDNGSASMEIQNGTLEKNDGAITTEVPTTGNKVAVEEEEEEEVNPITEETTNNVIMWHSIIGKAAALSKCQQGYFDPATGIGLPLGIWKNDGYYYPDNTGSDDFLFPAVGPDGPTSINGDIEDAIII